MIQKNNEFVNISENGLKSFQMAKKKFQKMMIFGVYVVCNRLCIKELRFVL